MTNISSQTYNIENQESTKNILSKTILKLKHNQTSSQDSTVNCMSKVKSANTENNLNKVMSEVTVKAQTIDDQIEKLRNLIGENHGSCNPSDNQFKRTEKLQHKLRYLEFFQSYSVDSCPA